MNSVPWSASLAILAERFGNAPAVTDQYGGRLSYRGLCDRAHAFAAQLARRGMPAGAPVAVLLPNCIDAVWIAHGIRIAGLAEAPLSWSYTADEIGWAAQVGGFTLVLTREERFPALQALGLDVVLPSSTPETADPRAAPWPPIPADVRARLLFTSGTTGRPKGVVYTHGGRWIGEQLLKATLPFTPTTGARILLVTPFAHGASLLGGAWCDHGGEVLLWDGVDPPRIRALLRQGGIEAFFAPPTVLAKLCAAFGDERFDGVRCIFTGTQPLGVALYARVAAMFGPVVRVTYGKTECINPITVLSPAETQAWFEQAVVPAGACVGWPAPGVEIEIRDGEVWLRAQQMSRGMLGPDGPIPHADGGWHATGDLGHIDERGRLVLVGRVADVIKTGGYRVHPDEIEACLGGLPDCADVCVVSLPSEYWGDVIVAVAEQAEEGWIAAAQARVRPLSRHKRPRLHVAVPALPRNAQGKVRRRDLVSLLLDTHELVDGPYPRLERKTTPTPPP